MMTTLESIFTGKGNTKPSTQLRELLGLFGIFVWFFCSMYSYEEVLFSSYVYIPVFLILLDTSMILFGIRCGRDIDRLTKICRYLSPVGIALTGVMYLFPTPVFTILYMLSGLFLGPLVLRFIYGAVQLGGETRQFRLVFGAVAGAVLFNSFWALWETTYAIKFPILALLALAAFLLSNRKLPVLKQESFPELNRGRAENVKMIAFFVILFILNYLGSIIHTYFVNTGLESDIFLWFGATILPAAGFLLFAFLSDYKKELFGFIFGMALTLFGLALAFNVQGEMFIYPLMISDGLGAVFTEFFIIAVPIYFYRRSRHPFLMAGLGLVVMIITCIISWIEVLPEWFSNNSLSIPLFLATAVCAVLLLLIVLPMLARSREQNLAYTILGYIRLYENTPEFKMESSKAYASYLPVDAAEEYASSASVVTTESQASSIPVELTPLEAAGFTEEEKSITALLIEGRTQSEIARHLHVTSAEVALHMRSIRKKVSGDFDENSAVYETITEKYKLTKRESQVLRCLALGKSNADIAADLFIAEDTVKFHVGNMMKKLPVDDRYLLTGWVENYKD